MLHSDLFQQEGRLLSQCMSIDKAVGAAAAMRACRNSKLRVEAHRSGSSVAMMGRATRRE